MPGFYKVQGTTVEAIMGGIYHQFVSCRSILIVHGILINSLRVPQGGTIAHRVFHTRLLPHLITKDERFGLHEALHDATLEMQEKMGGPDAQLLSAREAEIRSSRMLVKNSPRTMNHQSSDKVASTL